MEERVNHPEYYIKGNFETIDIIDAYTSELSGIEAFCTGNIIKYICRWKNKNGITDLKKAQWYLQKLISIVEKETVNE